MKVMKDKKINKRNMIKIDIVNNKYTLPFDEYALSKKIAKKIFEIEQLFFDFSLTISIVSDRKIKNINKISRNIDKKTDVLSFPNINFDRPANFKKYIKKNKQVAKDKAKITNKTNCRNKYVVAPEILDMTNKTIFLGDIVISYDTLIRQAKTYGHSIKREYSFLLTHSILHLLCYDHMDKTSENEMFKKQNLVLEKLNIGR